ncbi:MAG: hypothetical protein KJ653_10260 [Candidatus Thermoplasmatota archaeon]|nr:hypothetical protein [Candidatus Thermoplasmatota archaeon]
MPDNKEGESVHAPLIPRYVVSMAAFVCAVALASIAILGPLGTGTIHYRTSQSGTWQIEGGDLVNLLLITPILLIGGVLHLLRRGSSKYFLILTPIVLMYTGMTIGIGQEWSNPSYTGNVENYFWLYLILVIGGLILLIASLSMFTEKDAPAFKPRNLRIYVGVMALFLLMFAAMWTSEISQVVSRGDTSSGSYKEAPTLFWVIRYFDLGITIPLGFLALFLLLTRPERTYSTVLLFFGFFITLGSAVNSMAWIMYVNNDPEFQAGSLVIFSVLGILSWGGLLYLVKDKLRWPTSMRTWLRN